MKSPHPASLLLFGLATLLAGSSLEGPALFVCGLGLVLAALLVAPAHMRLLLRRSRWLMLTMLAMFGWLTPGTPLAGVPGASQEGLWLAAASLSRLLIALAVVALILKVLLPAQLVAGMRALLAPLALLHLSRDRIAVRLALTLNEVEASRQGKDDTGADLPGSLLLPASALGVMDLILGLLAVALVFGAWLA